MDLQVAESYYVTRPHHEADTHGAFRIAFPPSTASKFIPARSDSLRGIACMAGGLFLFAAVDTQAKFLTESLHPLQIAWSRQLGLLVGVLILLAVRGLGVLSTKHPWLQIGRGALAAGSASFFIVALTYVPLADAVAVSFVAPFLVTILGALLLGERVGPRRWTAIAIGFLGMLMVTRPGLGVVHPAMFLVLVAATFFSFRQILSRRLSGSDRTVTTVAYTALSASVLLSLPVPFVWQTPDWGLEAGLLVSIALMAAVAEIMVIKSLELTQAVVLAPVHYSLLIWGTMYGWLIFDQLPDGWTWLGALIIVATGIYTLHRERLAKADSGP
ncbi:DMT family transporter [Pelagibius sp. Alg239-R121]|uniref:DMT family transporter n=1 Tax=Pelagibius sp. Alg239-R121 TaxID=2993448 RepID=UPI0024A71A90|nr:DMT family transporter [Pelagibius sp. Alg239-R121]